MHELADKLTLSGIKLALVIGNNDWEKRCRQHVYCDITFQTNAQAIAQQDDLRAAIDYDKVLEHIMAFAQSRTWILIETLAEHIAQELLQHFSTPWVQVTLRKPGAVLAAQAVSISIVRTA